MSIHKLTAGSASQLARLAVHPIVATDADPAGRIAAERYYWMLSKYRLDPLYPRLPEGADPADLLALRGPTALTEALAAAQPLADRLLNERLDNLPPARLSSKRPGSSPPDPPATGIRTAASSAHDCMCRWRRSNTPCSHSSKIGTPTRTELPNNPCRQSATSSAEYQQSSRARRSSGGLPSRVRRGEQFRRTGSDRRETRQDDQLVLFAADANFRHKIVTSLLAGMIAELLPVPTQRPSHRREDADRECRGQPPACGQVNGRVYVHPVFGIALRRGRRL
jgi:DNA primase